MNATSMTRAHAPDVDDLIDDLKHLPGATLPILHGLQDRLGYIPQEVIPLIARALNQTRAEISGVLSFYHHFRITPPGEHVLQVCRGEACQAMGSRSLEAHIKQTLGVNYHETTADQRVTLEPVYCLGNCACGPSVQLDDAVIGRVTAARFDQLLDEIQTEAVEVGA